VFSMKSKRNSSFTTGLFLFVQVFALTFCSSPQRTSLKADDSKTEKSSEISQNPPAIQSGEELKDQTNLAQGAISKDLRPQVIMLYVSDLHGRLRPELSGMGGYARLSQWIKSERIKAGDQSDVIAIAGGDIAGKSALPCRKSSEMECFRLLKEVGFDLAVLGNGELKRSSSELNDLIQNSGIAWTSANVKSLDSKNAWQKTFEWQGHKSKSSWLFLSWSVAPSPGEVDLKKAKLDIKSSLADAPWDAWEKLAQGKNTVLVPHQEYEDDVEFLKTACQKNTLKPLLLLKSNDHKFRDEKIDCAPLLEPGAYGERAVKVVFQPDETGKWFLFSKEFVPMSSEIPDDPLMKARIEALYQAYAPTADNVVGTVTKDLNQVEFAKWVGAAFRKVTRSDIAVVNNGAIKEDLKAGPLSEERLSLVYPYNDDLMGFDVNAREFEKVLCAASQRVKDPFEDYGSDLILSGVDLENAGTTSCRIVGPKRASYKVAMVSFLVKRSKRWLGKDFTSNAFKWQVRTEQAFEKMLQDNGRKL